MAHDLVRGKHGPDSDVVFTVLEGRIVGRETFPEWTKDGLKLVPPHLGEIGAGRVDIHCHGGGGHSFCTTDQDEARAAAAFHHRSGSTTVIASLVTAPEATLRAQIRTLRPLVSEGTIAGIHLEGPFLAASRCGAQDPRYLTAPDVLMTKRLLDAGEGCVIMVTLAPELPGAAEVVKVLDEAEVVVAFGHTDADYAAFQGSLNTWQARVVTHLGNGMAPLHHRAPGPVGAVLGALGAPRPPYVELIADGQHVADEFVALVGSMSQEMGVVLVSDAMAAAGMPDGQYRLGELDVAVRDGVARLANGALAGSTSTLSDIARRAARVFDRAETSATAAPAEALGLLGAGTLEEGSSADLVVLGEDRRVRKVMRRGEWLS